MEVIYTKKYEDTDIYSVTYMAKHKTLGIMFYDNNEPYLYNICEGTVGESQYIYPTCFEKVEAIA